MTLDGRTVASFRAGDRTRGEPFLPAGLCVRDGGTVLVADTGAHRIVQWTMR
jgi:hypothetical protein